MLRRSESLLKTRCYSFRYCTGFWVANFVAFNGDVVRELASELLTLAEKQGASVPLMIAHRSSGNFPVAYGRHRTVRDHILIARLHSTTPQSIVHLRRDLAETLEPQY